LRLRQSTSATSYCPAGRPQKAAGAEYVELKDQIAGEVGRITKKALEAFLHEASLPAPDAGLGLAGSAHDLVRADAVGREQDDLGLPRMLLRGLAVSDDRLRSATETVMEIPVRMRQTRIRDKPWESLPGLKRQNLSTPDWSQK
jgi:hypothetical protein